MKHISMLIAALLAIIVFTSCSNSKDLHLADKYHINGNLTKEQSYTFSDGTSVDRYEQSDIFYYISGSDELLLSTNPTPSIWEYDEVKNSVSEKARQVLHEEISNMPLYDLAEALNNAYEDYCYCKRTDSIFQNHVVFLDATVSADSKKIVCTISTSYPQSGHFEGELVGTQNTYVFSSESGKLVASDQ